MKKSLIALMVMAAAGVASAQAPAAKPEVKPEAKPAVSVKAGEAPKGLTITPAAPGVQGGPAPQRPAFKPIVKKEHLKRESDRFDEVDKNKNGVITEDEMKAFREERMKKMREARGNAGPGGAPGLNVRPGPAGEPGKAGPAVSVQPAPAKAAPAAAPAAAAK